MFLKPFAGLTGTLQLLKRSQMPMTIFAETPWHRAQAKREAIERELRKSPDFQLYLVAKPGKERARMQRLLMEIPRFRLWHKLSNAVWA